MNEYVDAGSGVNGKKVLTTSSGVGIQEQLIHHLVIDHIECDSEIKLCLICRILSYRNCFPIN